jgi:hypothetical protein
MDISLDKPGGMAPHELNAAEYAALRATIRERGTVRACSILIGLAVWGALVATLVANSASGAVTLVPLVALAATFEISFFIHTGVERIGRYIQAFYEERAEWSGWETTVMRYGATFPSSGADPLFSGLFFAAALASFLSTLSQFPRESWNIVSVFAHAGFAYRIVRARRYTAAQRAQDLDRFRQLLSK